MNRSHFNTKYLCARKNRMVIAKGQCIVFYYDVRKRLINIYLQVSSFISFPGYIDMTGILLKTVQLLIRLAKSHASAVKRIISMESEVNKDNFCILHVCNLKWLLTR